MPTPALGKAADWLGSVADGVVMHVSVSRNALEPGAVKGEMHDKADQYLAGPPQPPKRKLRPALTTLLVSSMPKTNGVGPTKRSRLPKS